jgi:hypothetical protein
VAPVRDVPPIRSVPAVYRGISVVAGVALFAVGLLGSPGGCKGVSKAGDRGEGMFIGRESLKGKIREHQTVLPPEVVRCGNCHAAEKQVGIPSTLAPRIDRALLLSARQRRGGPPSAYDAQSLCKLLRTGIDPAYILIAREMPIYDVDDAQCASLWRFLTEP